MCASRSSRAAREPFRIGDVEDLHRDVAIEDVIAGDVDGAHAAVAGDAGDFVSRIELGPRRRIAQAIDRAIGDHLPVLSERSACAARRSRVEGPPSSFAASASHSSSLEVSSRSRSSTIS